MNKRSAFAVAVVLAMPLLAHASCDSTKASIDDKLKAKNLSGYTLDVVSSDQADAGGKVVGNCEGDKKIVYSRGGDASDGAASTSDNDSTTPSKPRRHHAPSHTTPTGGNEAPTQPAAGSSSGG